MISSIKREQNKIITVIGVLLFAYTAVRAVMLCITWDEAYTYIEFARNGKVFLDKYDMMSANNHMLNTFLMMVCTKLFGLHEFVMRMPVLLAHFLFLFYSAKIVKNIDGKWLAAAAYIIINVNPYMLDFFSLARGYGLSLGLMMSSIYFFYLFHGSGQKGKHASISLVFAALAVFANFVMLNYCVVLFGLIVILNIYFIAGSASAFSEKIKTFSKQVFFPLLIMSCLCIIVIPIALQLKQAGALFFGGESSFWSDTISTITDRCFYEMGYNFWFQRIAKGFVFLILVVSAISFFLHFFKKQLNTNTLFSGSLLALLLFCSLSTIVQHHLMQTPYLLDRTALFLVVQFNLIFVFLVAVYAKEKPLAASGLIYISSALAIIHSAMCFNLTYTLEWKFDANTKEMLSDIEKIKVIPPGKETISIGIPLTFDPAINFYREKNQLTWLNTAWRGETTSPLHDFYCLKPDDLKEFNPDSIEIIKTYPVTGNMLAKPKYRPKEIKAAFKKELDYKTEGKGYFTIDSNVEYAPGFSYIVNDSITPNRQAVLAFYTEVMAPDMSMDNLIMVLSFQDSNAQVYSWQKVYIKDFIRNENNWFRTSFTCVVPVKTKVGDEIKAYIWNPDKHLLYLRHEEFHWLSYSF